jgi:hypothetical protein
MSNNNNTNQTHDPSSNNKRLRQVQDNINTDVIAIEVGTITPSSTTNSSRKRNHDSTSVITSSPLVSSGLAHHHPRDHDDVLLSPDIIKTMLSAQDKRGNAATIILRVTKPDSEPHFVLQLKTEGYPYATMVGSLCLFGGNKEPNDVSARDTLLRECMEELPSTWCNEIEKTLRPYSRFVITASKEACAPKPFSYSFMCAVFEATLPYELVASTHSNDILEGKFELWKLSDLVGENTPSWCWGYDVVLTNYLQDVLFERDANRLPKFRTDYVRCDAKRIVSKCSLPDELWSEQEEWR